MDISFDLLSSMSPKLKKTRRPIYKSPSVLALKKYFRKSLRISDEIHNPKNESIITINSSCSSVSSEVFNRTPIVISESENSFSMREKSLSQAVLKQQHIDEKENNEKELLSNKYEKIENWIMNVNKATANQSIFSEVSTISNLESCSTKQNNLNIALNSTSVSAKVKRFDEFFKNSERKKSSQVKSVIIEDSLLSEVNIQNDFEDDSFDLNLNTSLTSRIKQKEIKNGTPEGDLKHLLDSLYGNSWREKENEILPASEPRVQTKKQTTKNFPKTERRRKIIKESDDKSNKFNLNKLLLKVKASESPWTNILNKVCDSDSESDSSESYKKNLPHVKLTFDKDSSSDEDSDKLNAIKVKKKVEKRIHSKANTASSSKFSFLASLSGSAPKDKCDMSALIFRDHFQAYKHDLVKKLFDLFNEKIFENSIPKDTPFEWSDRMRGTAGTCTCKKITRSTGLIERTAKITLAAKVIDSADRLRDTLVHELCHAATWIVNQISDGHGSFWKSWAQRAMQTFPELPQIKRCHNYVINTKYTYKCTGCGYSIGRHTKSLDTERKKCGYCYGTFEVLINKTTKKGEIKTVPATPKKVNGFALFVKENYADLKTPERKHGDVMKLLSKKFSDLKVANKT